MRLPFTAPRALTFAIGCSLLSALVGAAEPPKAAPPFALKDNAGRVHALAEFKGHVVLVDFWASWCAPCKASFPALDSLHQDLHAEGLEVVAINVDEDRKSALGFLAGRSPSMTVLFDPEGRSPQEFGVEGMPSSYLIDREGRVRFRHLGFTAQTKADFRREISMLLKEGSARATSDSK